jgi:hypothetical protein
MASVILTGDSSGTITLSAPSVAGSNTITMPASTGTVALTSNVIGVGQTWQNVTSSRALGTTYTNSTGKPIQVSMNFASTSSTSYAYTVAVDGVTIVSMTTNYVCPNFNFIVPDGKTYVVSATGNSLGYWAELR